MKPLAACCDHLKLDRRARVRIGLLIVVGCVAFGSGVWWLLAGSSGNPQITKESVAGLPRSSALAPPAPVASAPRSEESSDADTIEPAAVKRQDRSFSAKEYLETATDEIDALGALYAYTKDPAYLDALKKKALSDPRAAVLFASSNFPGVDLNVGVAERLETLRGAHANFPDDAVLTAALAGTEALLGNHTAALALIKNIKGDSTLREASVERQRALRELMLLSGRDVADAWKQATAAEAENMFRLSAIVNPIAKSISGISQMPLDGRIETTSAVISLARVLNPTDDINDFNAIIALGFEKNALKRLPGDIEYGEGGKTVASRLAEIEARYARAAYLRETVYPFLESAGPGVLQSFLERREQYGTEAAVEWAEKLMAR